MFKHLRYLLFLGFFFYFLAPGKAQQLRIQEISLNLEQATIEEALTKLAEQYQIRFYYTPIDFPSQRLDYLYQNTPLASALEELLAPASLGYFIYRDQSIAILPQENIAKLTAYREQFYQAMDGQLQKGTSPQDVITIGNDQPSQEGRSGHGPPPLSPRPRSGTIIIKRLSMRIGLIKKMALSNIVGETGILSAARCNTRGQIVKKYIRGNVM